MKEVTVTRVGVGSLGRLLGFVNAIVALITGVIAAIVSTANVIASNNLNFWEGVVVSIAVVAGYVILLPLLAFAFGWLYGAIVALVWNFFLGSAGGIDIEMVDKKK